MKVYAGKGILCFGTIGIWLALLVYGCQTMVTPMTAGERLYRAKCGSCHQPVDPETRTADQWRTRLERHGPKLTDAERATMLTYLTQHRGDR